MKKNIRVMITDDHPLYRKAASAALDCQSWIEVVSLCASGHEAIESIPVVLPDIIMMDIHMQPMDGIEATAKIKALYPDIKIIGFSLESQPHIADRMIKAGDKITIDGSTGEVFLGEVPTVQPELSGDFARLMGWL